MNDSIAESRAQLRRNVYTLLIALSTAVVLGRVLAVDSIDKIALENYRVKKVDERLDRERTKLQRAGVRGEALERRLAQIAEKDDLWGWARLRRPFLSGNDRSRWCTVRALVEDDLRVEGHPYAIDRVIQEPGWDTIDMVKHDGHLYSSKPPLFPTMMAAEYWLIHRLTGMTLETHPYVVGRFMLVTVNLLPLLVYFWLLARLIERFGTTDWGRLLVMAAAAFGTYLTTFAVVINNHLPAAISAAVALYAAVRIWFDDERRWRYFVVAGFFAAFAAANELPALTLFGALSLALLWKAPSRTMLGYLPAVLVVGGAFFATNWIAHEDLKPPYLHRSETNPDDNWYRYEYQRNGKTHRSYWENPAGVDRGEPSPLVYAAHIVVGHHGVFSLTPVWLLSAAGTVIWLCRRRDPQLRQLALLIGGVTAVCLAFYLTRGQHHRNYGGVTSGFRWMFWFSPLWLAVMLPAADAMAGRRWTRGIALVLLVLSVLSASYPTWNPWVHPWLMDYLHYLGWGG
ncbi:MAG: hypothetical protein JXB62_06635 [Pirellulales bacterium]|nr:hypothetical protein [Pirellulales bacterium]